jgi:hypothetical protein
MIVNYRRVFQVGIKVNKTPGREIIITDYAKQCYPRIDEEIKDNKVVFCFYYPDVLRKFLDEVLSG